MWLIRITCWIPNTKSTHLQYVILITFPLQQWLHEGKSLLRYTYFAYFVSFYKCYEYVFEWNNVNINKIYMYSVEHNKVLLY